MHGTIERDNDAMFSRLRKRIKLPSTRSYRQWNAEEPHEMSQITGRVQKFIFTIIVVLSNALLAILLFFLSSNIFSWIFFGLVIASLLPKVYGAWRYLNHENRKERLGYYNDDFIDPETVYRYHILNSFHFFCL